jgi:hypothetical protein
MSSFGTGIWLISLLSPQFCRGLSRPALTSIKPPDISFGPLAYREIPYAPFNLHQGPARRHH